MAGLVSATIDPPMMFHGVVEEFEATSSGVKSGLFSFYVGGASFQISNDTADNLFGAMAALVAASFFSKLPIAVTTYEQMPSGVYLVNIIRNYK
jgi:hypothetical protein